MASQTSDPQPQREGFADASSGEAPSSQAPKDAETLDELVSEHIDEGPATEDLDEDPAYNPQDEHLRGIKGG